jgi:hypothetical protein
VVEITTSGARRGVLVVHLSDGRHTCRLIDILGKGADYAFVRKIDEGSASCMATTFDGTITFDGLGVAIAMADAALSG